MTFIRNNLNIEIRRMELSDLKALMEIKNSENWNQTEKDWIFLIRSNPDLCLVAVLKNEVIGTVTAINYQDKIAWIGMMLVAIPYRGMGISKTLLNIIIKKLKNCVSLKLDATQSGVTVYKKLGFVIEYKIDRMVFKGVGLGVNQISNCKKPIYISSISRNEIEEVANLDETIFGVNRTVLLDYLNMTYENSSMQLTKNSRLEAYVFGRNGSNYYQLGPMMADSISSAKKLLNYVLIKLKDQPIVVDVLADKTEFTNWLSDIGFVRQRSFTRMYLKSNKYSGTVENQYLIGGPEMG